MNAGQFYINVTGPVDK